MRSLLDCLVAAAALRTGSSVLARDRHFAVLAAVSPLSSSDGGERPAGRGAAQMLTVLMSG